MRESEWTLLRAFIGKITRTYAKDIKYLEGKVYLIRLLFDEKFIQY